MSGLRSPAEPLAPLQQALIALEAMQRRLDAAESVRRGPIAVIGMACRFPGSANEPDSFWRMLEAGNDGLSEVPPDRWDIDAVYDPDPAAEGKMITRRGGFLKGVAVDRFDAAFFGISAREANAMDPQQRLLLEVAWEALEDAGLAAEQLKESRTGVFVGAMNADYQSLEPTGLPDTYAGPGNEFSFLAGRLAFILGLRGPNIVATTACSSSLVALHLACQSLRLGECETALAGGVNLMLSPGVFIGSSQLGALAPDGRCKTFDQAADGYARGEGCGVLVLKRIADAQRDRDAVLAVIRGSAVNHNGASGGLTVPSSAAQQAVITDALAASGLTPANISCVEAHGTGTSLGDLIEVQALAGVFGAGPARAQKLRLGSVKANLGHLEAASGVAAVIKVILALSRGVWPGQVHFHTPNQFIPWGEIPIEVTAKATPWPPGGERPRRAGVSSFGLSGINSHLVIEEAPPPPRPAEPVPELATFVLPLSARDPAALAALAFAWRGRLAVPDADSALRDLCYTAARRRSHHGHRLAVSGAAARELAERLGAHLDGAQPAEVVSGAVPDERRRVVFVFPGQGCQWPGMARALLVEPAFRAELAECDAAMRPHLGWSVEAALREADPARVAPVEASQPLVFAYQLALASLWRDFGVAPDAVIGHSFGEVAAAVVAGALDRDQAAGLICRRSRLVRQAIGAGTGAMALVELSWDEAQAAIEGRKGGLTVALCNGPRTSVLSGDPEAIERIVSELAARDVFCRRLHGLAGHSPQMVPFARLLAEEIAGLTPREGVVPFYSTVTGGLLEGTRLDAGYWARNLCEPVLFWPTLRGLVEAGPAIFLEIGPSPVLCPSIESALYHLGREGDVVPSARRNAEAAALRAAVGKLYVGGAPLRWERIAKTGALVPAPRYPWQRRRAWWTGAAAERKAAIAAPPNGCVPAPFVRLPDLAHLADQHFWQAEGDAAALDLAQDRTIATPRLEALALAAAVDGFGEGALRVEEIAIAGPLPPSTGRLQMILARAADGSPRVTLYGARSDDPAWQLHATVTLRPAAPGEQWVYEVAFQPCGAPGGRGAESGPVIVLADAGGVGAALDVKLAARGADAVLVPPGGSLPKAERRGGAAGAVARVIDLRGLDARPETPEGAAEALRALLQDVLTDQVPSRVWVVTCGAQDQASATAPEQAALWGLGRAFALEHPDRWGGIVDLEPGPAAEQAEALLSAFAYAGEDQLDLLDGKWRAARLVRASLPEGAPPWRADATYLVTGGLGGLGLGLLRRMVGGGARHIVVVGRTPLPPRSRWAELPADPRIAAVLELEASDATVEAVAADVADERAMADLFAMLRRREPPLAGILHLAGTSTFAPLEGLDSAALAAVLRPKIRGALVLEAETRDLPLDLFVLFSSAAAAWGASGQAHYAAANAFLDALALRRRAAGLPGLSVAWGRVTGGGMASAETEAFADRLGLLPMAPDQAFAILEALIAGGEANRVVVAVDWARFKPIHESRRRSPLLSGIAVSEAPLPAAVGAAWGAARRRILAAPPSEQGELLNEVVAAAVAEVLGIETPSTIDRGLGFFRQGMDSIMAVQLRRALERALGLPLSPTIAFEHPSLSQLGEHLAAVLGLRPLAEAAPSAAPLPGGIDVSALERMSDAEAEALLVAELNHGAAS
jgi:acyl transferase domain-containing protein